MPTLNWIGKEAVVNHHHEVPYHLVQCDPSLSVGDPGSGNLLVEGDNLLALKALLPYYAGKVKCIYIDLTYHREMEHVTPLGTVQLIAADNPWQISTGSHTSWPGNGTARSPSPLQFDGPVSRTGAVSLGCPIALLTLGGSETRATSS